MRSRSLPIRRETDGLYPADHLPRRVHSVPASLLPHGLPRAILLGMGSLLGQTRKEHVAIAGLVGGTADAPELFLIQARRRRGTKSSKN